MNDAFTWALMDRDNAVDGPITTYPDHVQLSEPTAAVEFRLRHIGWDFGEGSVMSEVDTIVQRALLDLIDATNDAILITSASDLDRPGPRIVYANAAFCKISGYAKEEVIPKAR